MGLNFDGTVEPFDSEIFSPKNITSTIETLVIAMNSSSRIQFAGDEIFDIVTVLTASKWFPYLLEHEYERRKKKAELRPIKKNEQE